jgi:hypothetical protein
VFAAENAMFAANQRSLPKMQCLQRINVHCRSFVVCNKIVFVQRNCVVFSESAFSAEIELSVANEHSLPKMCLLQ